MSGIRGISGFRGGRDSDYFLLGNYAILVVPDGIVDTVAALPQITYMEKPKRLFLQFIRDGQSLASIQFRGTAADCLGGGF